MNDLGNRMGGGGVGRLHDKYIATATLKFRRKSGTRSGDRAGVSDLRFSLPVALPHVWLSPVCRCVFFFCLLPPSCVHYISVRCLGCRPGRRPFPCPSGCHHLAVFCAVPSLTLPILIFAFWPGCRLNLLHAYLLPACLVKDIYLFGCSPNYVSWVQCCGLTYISR